jgi:hypothetical protein
MAVNQPGQGQQQNTGGDGTGGNTTSMGAAFARASTGGGQQGGGNTQATQTTGAPAPAHATLNTGDGRNPTMDHGRSSAGAPFSLRQMGGGMRTFMNRSANSEVLTKTQKAIETMYKESGNATFEYALIPIDMNQTANLSVSALVVAVRDKHRPDLGVAYHALILQGSAEDPGSRFEQIGGKNVEIIRTVSEAYDQVMNAAIFEAVQRTFPNANLFNAEATVVPRDFPLDDSQQLYRLAANAAFACSQEIETRDPQFSDVNLANAEKDSNLTVRTLFAQDQSTDVVGQPMRTDVIIDFQAQPLNQNQQQQNLERTTLISRIAGYMDIVWDAPQTPTGFGISSGVPGAPGWGPATPSYQRYAARFVATQLDSEKLLTIPAQLLALMPALALRDNNAWVHAFKPNPTLGGDDIHDIGAIGIEVNMEGDPSGFGKRIDTKTVGFKDESLFKLIALTFKPGLILSMDVPECGPQTWYNSWAAAVGEGNARAYDAVIAAANLLTNQNFSRYWTGGAIAINENNRIHLGYYTDRNGVRRDIRDIDYLAVLNLMGEKDPMIAKEWSDTFLRVDYPLAVRLSERARILRGLVDNVVFTGYATRVTFTGEFIDALAQGCRDAGLTMRAATAFADLRSYERANGGHLGSALLNPQGVGLFNRGTFGMGNATAGGRGWAGRW